MADTQTFNIDARLIRAQFAEFDIPAKTLDVVTSEMCRLRVLTSDADRCVEAIETVGYEVTSEHERWDGQTELYFHVNGVRP